MRYLTRVVTAEEYDEAVRRVPEMCPLYYMGDRRTGRQLLADFDADAAAAAALSRPASPASLPSPRGSASPPSTPSSALECGGGGGGCGWGGRLERIAAVVSGLAAGLAAAPAVTWDTWVQGVRRSVGVAEATDGCGHVCARAVVMAVVMAVVWEGRQAGLFPPGESFPSPRRRERVSLFGSLGVTRPLQ